LYTLTAQKDLQISAVSNKTPRSRVYHCCEPRIKVSGMKLQLERYWFRQSLWPTLLN